jgi:hypothetical protein
MGINMKYYEIMYSDEYTDKYDIGVGYIFEKNKKKYEDIEYKAGQRLKEKDLQEIHYKLKDGNFADLIPTNVGRLYSKKLMQIIKNHKSDNDCIQWIKAWVYLDDEKRDYYHLHFCHIENIDDLINKEHSFFAGEVLVKPVFNKNTLEKHCVTIEDEYSETPIICEKIKREIEKENVTGVDFRPVKMI